VLASLILGLVPFGLVAAVDPPQPDFFWPYGRVAVDGENIAPPQQPVIAVVNGKACGEANTQMAVAGPGVPAGDAGKTVYVVDVLAAGSSTGHRENCGTPGDQVLLYFPAVHRIAVQVLVFAQGSQRADVDLGPELQYRLSGAMLAGDGVE
jgi:hypothetical protein